MIPRVTQFDEADITELEAFRVQINRETKSPDAPKLTMLAFIIKACVAALKKFPELNASLDGENLVLKQCFHRFRRRQQRPGAGDGDADRTGRAADRGRRSAALAKKAREGKIGLADMQDGCPYRASAASAAGFHPIINAPEVAILGVSQDPTKPVWDGKAFVPRQMLPSPVHDHRGGQLPYGARFTAYLGRLLADLRRASLRRPSPWSRRTAASPSLPIPSPPLATRGSAAPTKGEHDTDPARRRFLDRHLRQLSGPPSVAALGDCRNWSTCASGSRMRSMRLSASCIPVLKEHAYLNPEGRTTTIPTSRRRSPPDRQRR